MRLGGSASTTKGAAANRNGAAAATWGSSPTPCARCGRRGGLDRSHLCAPCSDLIADIELDVSRGAVGRVKEEW